jgi:acyl-CoA thioesterase FadM
MERIEILLPDFFSFSTSIKIRITDLNYGGHAGNDVFLALLHEARYQFLLHHGYTELSFGGCGLIMVDAAIEFKKELYYGDEVKISIAASGFEKNGFDLFYRLEITNAGQTISVGKAKTGMLCYDYKQKKVVSLPAEAMKKLSSAP